MIENKVEIKGGTTSPEVKRGQFYKYFDGDSAHNNSVWMVVRVSVGGGIGYFLCCLNTGEHWSVARSDINDIFVGSKSCFTLVTEEIKIIPGF